MTLEKRQEKQLVSLLEQLNPGFLPYDVFVQVARLVPMAIIEFVPLRIRNNKVEILLLERSKFDDIWPGEVHTPGTVIRATDNINDRYMAFERILTDELNATETSNPHYVGSILHKSKRGMEQAQVYWIEVIAEPMAGKFYAVDNLPHNLMESQIKFIQQAINNYKTNKDL